MNTVTQFTKGIDSSTFKGVGYLLWLNVKKQIGLWVFIIFIILLCLYFEMYSINEYKNGWYTIGETKFFTRMAILSGTLIPLLFIALFSIPGTLNSIHKTTLIKRIGSTRLTEHSFILLITIWYTLISLAFLTSIFFGVVIIGKILSPPELSMLENTLKTYLFSIFLVILMVTMGVLLGTLPISQILVTTISVLLFIVSVAVGGFLISVTNFLGIAYPTIVRLIALANPLGFSSYSMASILTGGFSLSSAIASIIYMVSLSLLFFCASAVTMNFNKVK